MTSASAMTATLPGTTSAKAGGEVRDRLLARYFEVHNRELVVGGVRASALVERYGSPLFAYDRSIIARKVRQVRAILPERFQLFYSIKANPNAAILKCLLEAGCGLEVASGGELTQALAAGCSPAEILFAGPGKTEAELDAAVRASIREVHVESLEEAKCLQRVARRHGRTMRVALRVNPLGSQGGAMQMGGKASQFGIDEEELEPVLEEIAACSNLHVDGVHMFMGTQILDAGTLIDQYRRCVDIARRVALRVGPLRTIDFGGGWGTPYFSHEAELDLSLLGEGLASIDTLLAGDPLLSDAAAVLELGRFLVNEAGVYLCRVTRTKTSRGKFFAVADGGMHHHLAASGNLGQAIKRNYPVAVANKIGLASTRSADIVGPLCTPLDTLARGLSLPPIESGDLIAIFLSGAYARAASPLGFLSREAPCEVMVSQGHSDLIRRRGGAEDYLADQTGLA